MNVAPLLKIAALAAPLCFMVACGEGTTASGDQSALNGETDRDRPDADRPDERPPVDDRPDPTDPPDRCEEGYRQVRACYARAEASCDAIAAADACRDRGLAGCQNLIDITRRCAAADAPPAEECRRAHAGAEQCLADVRATCQPLYDRAEACFEPCHALEREVIAACTPEPRPEERMCRHLREALNLCIQSDRPARCRPLHAVAVDLCGANEPDRDEPGRDEPRDGDRPGDGG